jgi:MFS family permease
MVDHDPYAALRHRDYRRLLLGSVLASIANTLQAAALYWEVYQRTGDAGAIGFIGLVQFVPVLLLSLPAGHAVDRYSRRLILAGSQVVMVAACLGLAAISYFQAPVPLIYVCVLAVGFAQSFSAPARWSLVPLVVPARDIANAMTWNSGGWQIASIAGPALAGGIISATDQAAPAYLVPVACSLAFACLAISIRPVTVPRPHEELSLKSLLAGIHFIHKNKVILATITLDLFAVLFGGATALIAVYAEDILHVGPAGYGWLRASPALGALIMAVAMAHRRPLRRAGRTLLWAVTGFGAATIVFGLSRDFALSFAMLALTGALDNISMVVRGTLVQTLTPDAMRGRVSAVNAIFIGSSNQLGDFESGITARYFGPVISVVAGGVGTILVVLTVMAAWPQVIRLGPLHEPEELTPVSESA